MSLGAKAGLKPARKMRDVFGDALMAVVQDHPEIVVLDGDLSNTTKTLAVREAYPDFTALDPDDPHYDPKENADSPRWCMVDVKLKRKLKRIITLSELKERQDESLADFALLKRGNRLSVLPVTAKQWKNILAME